MREVGGQAPVGEASAGVAVVDGESCGRDTSGIDTSGIDTSDSDTSDIDMSDIDMSDIDLSDLDWVELRPDEVPDFPADALLSPTLLDVDPCQLACLLDEEEWDYVDQMNVLDVMAREITDREGVATSADLALLARLGPSPKQIAALWCIDAERLESIEQRQTLMQLWDRAAAWTTMNTLAAAKAMADAIDELDARLSPAQVIADGVITSREVGLASGLGDEAARDRVDASRALGFTGRFARTALSVRRGRVSPMVARALAEMTAELTDDQARSVEASVLPLVECWVDEHTGEGTWRPVASVRRLIRRAVLRIAPDLGRRKRQEAVARRDVTLTPEPSTGMAWLNAYLPAEQAMAAYAACQLLAEASRVQDGEMPRSWGQARADVLATCLIDAAETLVATGVAPVHHGRVRLDVGVLIDLPTLMGLADRPGEILGYGPIDPALARSLAADASWRRWVQDPVTGHLWDYGQDRYVPPQRLRDFVLARDGWCTRPGCQRHAHHGDLDHVEPFARGGPTSARNLRSTCRRHHRDKTEGRATVRVNDDGSVTWRSRFGIETRSEAPYLDFLDDRLHGEDPWPESVAPPEASQPPRSPEPPMPPPF